MTSGSGGLRRRGGIWYIDYYDATGKRVRERVGVNRKRAVRARAVRLAEIEQGKFGLRRHAAKMTLATFVESYWRPKRSEIGHRRATRRSYELNLRHHLLPAFGRWPLRAITYEAVRTFIAELARTRRRHATGNPDLVRPPLAPKTVKNIVSLLRTILQEAVDFGLLPRPNPLAEIMARKNFPADARPDRDRRPRVLEPDDFRRAIERLRLPARRMALVAALAGVRWGEQIALRIDQDVDFTHNHLRVTRKFYKRVAEAPKTPQSVRDIDMSPIVRRIMADCPRTKGLVFSKDGVTPMDGGSWLRTWWYEAQRAAGIVRPIRWHDLRHQYVSLMIACGKNPLYIAEQAGHSDPGFTLRKYGHLFRTLTPRYADWPEDLIWPPDHVSINTSFVTNLGPFMSSQRPETPGKGRTPAGANRGGDRALAHDNYGAADD